MRVTDKKYTKNIYFYTEDIPKKLELLVKQRNIRSLLDLGCGDGTTLFALKKRGLLKNKNVFAVDLAKERIFKTQKVDKNFHCFISDACNLDGIVEKNSLDLVISSQVIEHVKTPQELIRQVRIVLKQNGYFYLSTVFKKWYAWYFYKNNNGKWVLDPTHLREYRTDGELIPLLKKLGFRVIYNNKTLWRFPITDFFLKRFGFGSNIYQKSKLLSALRSIKLPILGYYYWEIICRKT